MDESLKGLISHYLDAVARAVSLLENAGIPMPDSNADWALSGIAATGSLNDVATYRKHGYGCIVKTAEEVVDFDFGALGETNGFDSWRLWRFIEANDLVSPYTGHRDIECALEQALASELIVQPQKGGLCYVRPAT